MLLLNYPDENQIRHIEPETGKKKISSKKIYLEVAKIAAIFIIAVTLSFYFLRDTKEVTQAWNTIEVPIGQRTFLTLADGTKVWLNAKTRFTFPNHFNRDNRTVKLDGEAIFDVVHNQDAPFIVETQKYNVKVLGTEFNVYAYNQSNSFE
ncbi:MAG: FecR domain-containing protein, partial [Bacteroidetes bacterium]|nr:FecR domain-containing protein [Bacteroidota bacterium]